jgi:hypothetical protein
MSLLLVCNGLRGVVVMELTVYQTWTVEVAF